MWNAQQNRVWRHFVFALVLTFCMRPLQGATLERLSLEDMIAKSTAVVRGRVVASFSQFHGPIIYTHYKIQVAESYKGKTGAAAEVIVPGGASGSVRQDVAGAPELKTDSEYVLFLWTGPSGLTQIMGLTQGIFAVPADGGVDPVLVRKATTELMLDPRTAQAVKDQRLSMPLSDLKSRIKSAVKTLGQGFQE
jgi:hypothetical protein